MIVLQSAPRPTHLTNPYVTMLRDSIDALDDVEALYFDWATAFSARYDVYHVHWPEILVGGRTPLRRSVRQARVLALLAWLRLRRVPLVRTVHNEELPEGIGITERALLILIERMTTMRIVLNRHTRVPTGAETVLIPHSHYRDWYYGREPGRPISGRITYVGRVRRYKGVDRLIRAFRDLADPDVRLRVAGFPSSEDLSDSLRLLAAGDTRISLRFAMLTDDDVASEVEASEVVVLPYPRMHNSGAVLLALSLDRPVLVPRNPVNEDLAKEVGIGWVYMFDGDLAARDLETAIALHRSHRHSRRPDLSARDWHSAATAHKAAYARALSLA